jgi:hypothetical protein
MKFEDVISLRKLLNAMEVISGNSEYANLCHDTYGDCVLAHFPAITRMKFSAILGKDSYKPITKQEKLAYDELTYSIFNLLDSMEEKEGDSEDATSQDTL